MAREDNDVDDAYKAIGKAVSLLAAVPALAVLAVLTGLVLYKYWGWFVTPVFTSLPTPTILQFIALRLFVGVLTTTLKPPRTKTDEEKAKEKAAEPGAWEGLAFGFFLYGFLLLVGWLIYLAISWDPHWVNNLLGM